MQIWMRQGQNIVNSANGQCLQIAVTDCSHFGFCNRYANQTGIPGTLWNAVAAPCVEGSLSQAWTLLPQPGQPLLDYVPLNISAAAYPPPDETVAAEVLANSPEVSCSTCTPSWPVQLPDTNSHSDKVLYPTGCLHLTSIQTF